MSLDRKPHTPAPTSVDMTRAITKREEARELRTKQNLSTYGSAEFKEACNTAGVPPTIRQASKYRRAFGAAYRGAK